MNDSDNKSNREQISDKEANAELKINRRSLGVYEQYLRKTTQNLACEQQGRVLSSQTANLFENEEESCDDFSEMLYDSSPKVDTQTSEIAFRHQAKISDNRSNNNSKVITVVVSLCALLLTAVLVIVFNANNTLTTLIDHLSLVNTQVSEVSQDISVIGQENALANAKAIADDKAERAANAARLASVNESLNTIASSITPIAYKSAAPATTRLRSMKVGDIDTEPTISYDDFKNESQIIVYREASN